MPPPATGDGSDPGPGTSLPARINFTSATTLGRVDGEARFYFHTLHPVPIITLPDALNGGQGLLNSLYVTHGSTVTLSSQHSYACKGNGRLTAPGTLYPLGYTSKYNIYTPLNWIRCIAGDPCPVSNIVDQWWEVHPVEWGANADYLGWYPHQPDLTAVPPGIPTLISPNAELTFNATFSGFITLWVTDSNGLSAAHTISLIVTDPPPTVTGRWSVGSVRMRSADG